jgi:glycosyltransferase involved in cell wall biosynthesis
MRTLVEQGHEVIACVPAPSEDLPQAAELEALGVRLEPIVLDRAGINPLADVGTLRCLVAVLRRLKPDTVLAYTIKPVIYGSLAARIAGVPTVCSIVEGIGYAFSGGGPRRVVLRTIVKLLYRVALSANRRVFFLNPDNKRLFEDLGLARRSDQSVLLGGIGVDLERFAPAPLPETVTFLLIARLLRDKGVPEFVDAARIVRACHPEVRFHLVGWIDSNPMAVGEAELRAWIEEGVISYLGKLDDVRPALADASVFVLPSYYPEGQPRSIMEAMATGRPILTTDMPGCRETVVDGANGFLVPAQDAPALARAMLRFVEQPELIVTMGRESRRIAEAKYDVHRINHRLMAEMGLA